MRKAIAVAVATLIFSIAGIGAANAKGWHMAACDYEQSWIRECEQPWTYPAPNVSYRIRKGDTLWRIAVRAYGGGKIEKAGHRWTEIQRFNRIHGTRIKVGQKIVVPRALYSPVNGAN